MVNRCLHTTLLPTTLWELAVDSATDRTADKPQPHNRFVGRLKPGQTPKTVALRPTSGLRRWLHGPTSARGPPPQLPGPIFHSTALVITQHKDMDEISVYVTDPPTPFRTFPRARPLVTPRINELRSIFTCEIKGAVYVAWHPGRLSL